MTLANSSTSQPSATDLRDAFKFVFDDLQWGFKIRSDDPLILDVHGNADFEKYRSQVAFREPHEVLVQAFVLAIVALASRLSRLTIGLTSVGVVDQSHAKKQARRRARNRIRRVVWRAMAEAGLSGVLELQVRTRPHWRILLDADEADLSDGVREACFSGAPYRPAGFGNAVASTEVPVPDLPWASKEALSKAVKYVLVDPLRLRIEQTMGGLRLHSENKRGEPYLAGAMVSSPAERARSAIALAVRHLARSTEQATFDAIVPVTAERIDDRLAKLRQILINEVATAIMRGGHSGLVELCRSGLGRRRERSAVC